MDIITLTFGDMAENSVGMEKLGNLVNPGEGFQLSDLNQIKELMEIKQAICELIPLGNDKTPEAFVLVIKNGVNILLSDYGFDKEKLFEEQANLEHDKYKFQRGGVVNSRARYNLCFGENNQEPDYANKKGRIVSYNNVPITKTLLDSFAQFGDKATNLQIEANYYYDKSKCGIGFHGDKERRKVIGIRLGDEVSSPLLFQWYLRLKPRHKRIEIPLEAGDIYIMSEKAVGTDWGKQICYTLRHATGSLNQTGKRKNRPEDEDE